MIVLPYTSNVWMLPFCFSLSSTLDKANSAASSIQSHEKDDILGLVTQYIQNVLKINIQTV